MVKRACRRASDARERNYMDHFDSGKKEKRERAGGEVEEGKRTERETRGRWDDRGNTIFSRKGEFPREQRDD